MFPGGNGGNGRDDLRQAAIVGFGALTVLIVSSFYLTKDCRNSRQDVTNSVTGRVISVETTSSSINQPLAELTDASGAQSVQMTGGRNYVTRVNDGASNSKPYTLFISEETGDCKGTESQLGVGTCVEFPVGYENGTSYFNEDKIGALGLEQITLLPPDQCGKK